MGLTYGWGGTLHVNVIDWLSQVLQYVVFVTSNGYQQTVSGNGEPISFK